jgi:integrase/recombinase XerD
VGSEKIPPATERSEAADLGKRCNPTMMCNTFEVEALLARIAMDQVSRMLGHATIKMTEEHYMPFVLARQDQLSASNRRMWPAQPAP